MSDSKTNGQCSVPVCSSRDEPPMIADGVDRLLMDCVELEERIASMSQLLDGLSLAIDAGGVTPGHVAAFAGRIEFAERELIEIARQIDKTATAVVRCRQGRLPIH